jgi:hypothetical protein
MDSGSDVPRISVGPDGFVYIIYNTTYHVCSGDGGVCKVNGDCCSGACQNGACGNRNPVNPRDTNRSTLWVEKMSSCDDGFLPQKGVGTASFPAMVQTGINQIAEMPGLDRGVLGNFMIAPDDSDSNGQRVFLTFIDEVSQGGGPVVDGVPALASDNVRVAVSRNGALNWAVAPTPVNTTAVGHRFFPWICSTKGIAYLTWYDRRSSTATSTDLTSYFRSSMADQMGTLAVGAEVNVSGGPGFDDPQCLSGFPLGVRDKVEELLCTDLPPSPAVVTAGTCDNSPATRCDFRSGSPSCPSGGVCLTGDGAAKYGDYNGAACANGNLFMAWTTAVRPKGLTCAIAGAACTTSSDCCRGSTCFNSLCSIEGQTCTANGGACNPLGNLTCCSDNCLGGTCQPSVAIFASSTAVTPELSCATTPTVDKMFSGGFDVDTALPPNPVGANYGHPDCQTQYLVEVDLTAAAFQGRTAFTVSGFWSSLVSSPVCVDLQATLRTFVFNGTIWQPWDTVAYAGVLSGGGTCTPEAQSHTDAGSVGLGVARIPLNRGFQRVRIAVNAVQNGITQAIATVGQIF